MPLGYFEPGAYKKCLSSFVHPGIILCSTNEHGKSSLDDKSWEQCIPDVALCPLSLSLSGLHFKKSMAWLTAVVTYGTSVKWPLLRKEFQCGKCGRWVWSTFEQQMTCPTTFTEGANTHSHVFELLERGGWPSQLSFC